jgi:hypothetical protein
MSRTRLDLIRQRQTTDEQSPGPAVVNGCWTILGHGLDHAGSVKVREARVTGFLL